MRREFRRAALYNGIYSRVARSLGVSRSIVSRVAVGKGTSSRIEAALLAEVRRIEDAICPERTSAPLPLDVTCPLDARHVAGVVRAVLRGKRYRYFTAEAAHTAGVAGQYLACQIGDLLSKRIFYAMGVNWFILATAMDIEREIDEEVSAFLKDFTFVDSTSTGRVTDAANNGVAPARCAPVADGAEERRLPSTTVRSSAFSRWGNVGVDEAAPAPDMGEAFRQATDLNRWTAFGEGRG